jgi:signal transduction histidine kinase
MLSSQQHINLRRIAREAIANALKHAQPQNIVVQVSLDSKEICLQVRNDGAISAPSNWKPNRGLNNIRSRATELGGRHKWSIEKHEDGQQYCQLTVCVPLTKGEIS